MCWENWAFQCSFSSSGILSLLFTTQLFLGEISKFILSNKDHAFLVLEITRLHFSAHCTMLSQPLFIFSAAIFWVVFFLDHNVLSSAYMLAWMLECKTNSNNNLTVIFFRKVTLEDNGQDLAKHQQLLRLGTLVLIQTSYAILAPSLFPFQNIL